MNEGFLSRWSRRKHDSRRDEETRDREEPSSTERADGEALRPKSSERPDVASSPPRAPAEAGSSDAAGQATHADARSESAPELPPIDSLTPESDFRAFMRPGVDSSTRNAALAQLFRDPRYNEMDGLDVYIDDYTQSEPIPTPILAKLKELHATVLPDEAIERRDVPGDTDEAASPQESRHTEPSAQMASSANDADDANDANENNGKPQETQG